MKTLSKQIEESILDGINTYKELAAIGRGFDVAAFSKMCAGEMRKLDLQRVKFLCTTAFVCGCLVGFMIAMILYAFGIWW